MGIDKDSYNPDVNEDPDIMRYYEHVRNEKNRLKSDPVAKIKHNFFKYRTLTANERFEIMQWEGILSDYDDHGDGMKNYCKERIGKARQDYVDNFKNLKYWMELDGRNFHDEYLGFPLL
mmetsp:Transcript_39029/g.51469  ORF Transcript_39029/g.51469 Transcript_39029/m.51469 type:complete len:119 (+) Transcript_39029:83-439(+)